MRISLLNRDLYKTKSQSLYKYKEQIIRRELGLRTDMPKDPKFRINSFRDRLA